MRWRLEMGPSGDVWALVCSLYEWDYCSYERNPRDPSPFLSSEDTGRRQPPASQEAGSHQAMGLLAPRSWTFILHNGCM